MGSLIGLLIARGWSERAARVISYAGLVLLLLGASAGLVAAYNHRVIGRYQQKQEQRARPATDKAADERANDATANAKHEQEMHDVIAAQPDQPIAPTSRALACERLRRAGRHPPACR